MSSEERKVPELRFKGFSDDWEQRKLENELALLKDGTHGTHKNCEEGPYLLSAKNIKNGKINISNDDRKISHEEYNKIHKNFKLKIGDVLLTIVGTIGETTILQNPNNITFQRSVAYLRPLNLQPPFLYNILNTSRFQKELKRRQVISAQPGIYLGDIKKIDISIAKSIKEQNKIGLLFEKINHLVDLHQGSINILEELKKAYLKEMFADNVNKIPNLRLNGFRKEWEQHKLGEIFNIFDNLRVPVKSSNRIYGNTPYYGANGIQDYVEGFTHKGEFILLAEDGANNLDNYPVHYVNGKVWVNNHAHVLQGKAEFIDNKFAVYLLRKTNIRKFLVGGGRAKLNANIMMQILLTIPILSEQIPIGQLLYQFDELIELHQRKLNKLEKLKTSYLNKMFL